MTLFVGWILLVAISITLYEKPWRTDDEPRHRYWWER